MIKPRLMEMITSNTKVEDILVIFKQVEKSIVVEALRRVDIKDIINLIEFKY